MNSRLSINSVTFGYSVQKQVLTDVSLDVCPRELVALIGPNGSGKSTLLRIASATLPPSLGNVFLEETDMSHLDRRIIAQRVAVVPQDVHVAFGFRVEQVVAMGRAPFQGPLGRMAEEDRSVVDEALRQAGIEHLRHRPVQLLSGGERKRVAIARALAQRPRVLLLDEASAHLDVRYVLEWYQVLRSLVEHHQLACLSVIHDLNEAARYADRVVLLREGRVVAAGDVDATLTSENLRETFGVEMTVQTSKVDGKPLFVPSIPK